MDWATASSTSAVSSSSLALEANWKESVCAPWRAKTGGGVFNSFGNILQPATIVTAFQRTARRSLSMTSRLAIPERSPTPAAVEGITSSGQLFWHPSKLFSRPNYIAHFLQRRLSITLRFPRFSVPRFPPLWFGAGFSSSAFSSLAFSAPPHRILRRLEQHG